MQWKASEQLLLNGINGTEMLLDGTRAPSVGEIMVNKNIASTLRAVGCVDCKTVHAAPCFIVIVVCARARVLVLPVPWNTSR